jgi:hypothetical protein
MQCGFLADAGAGAGDKYDGHDLPRIVLRLGYFHRGLALPVFEIDAVFTSDAAAHALAHALVLGAQGVYLLSLAPGAVAFFVPRRILSQLNPILATVIPAKAGIQLFSGFSGFPPSRE